MAWKTFSFSMLAAGSLLLAAEKPELRPIAKGSFSGIQERTGVLVTNQTQWAELWKKHSAREVPAKPAPEVDFEKESVLFVTLGAKRTGGYAVDIAGLKRNGDKTEVLVKTRSPKPGGFQIQALTAPFVIVAAPKITGRVRFVFDDRKEP